MLLHLEILKARYQTHVLGRHQLKVYKKPRQKPRQKRRQSVSATPGREDLEREMRDHPYLQQGGVFIFPSVHYLSSVYKRLDPYERPHEIPSVLSSDWSLSGVASSQAAGIERLFSGYPWGRSTALLGSRGNYKSHLGYVEILGRVLKDERSRGLVVSLRDDEGVTRRTLAQILATDHHFSSLQEYRQEEDHVVSERRRLQLEESGRLEIMYFPPGYITSEEFLHRLLVTVARLKADIQPSVQDEPQPPGLSLLFNSFDQLPSRFPLCARESMLIPAIVQMLDSENVTSFFVAAKTRGQAEGLYGLESTADLILEVERHSYATKAYLESIANVVGVTAMTERVEKTLAPDGSGQRSATTVRDALGEWRRIVTLDVVRYPGCEAMGRRGFVELVSQHDEALFELYEQRSGLHFVPDAPQPEE